MIRLLTVIEVAAIVLAVVLGMLWIGNPTGPYEPYAFMATLLGTTLTDMARRHIRSKEERTEWALATSEMLPFIVNAVRTEIDRAANDQSLTTQQLLQELIDRLPDALRTAIHDWEQRQSTKLPSSPDVVEKMVKHAEQALSDIYGVDQSKSAVGEISLTDIRMRRKKLD